MGFWNEGERTDGGGRVVSGQYHHGPVSPNINWVLGLCFITGGDGDKLDEHVVFVNEEDLTVWRKK